MTQLTLAEDESGVISLVADIECGNHLDPTSRPPGGGKIPLVKALALMKKAASSSEERGNEVMAEWWRNKAEGYSSNTVDKAAETFKNMSFSLAIRKTGIGGAPPSPPDALLNDMLRLRPLELPPFFSSGAFSPSPPPEPAAAASRLFLLLKLSARLALVP